MYTYMPRFSNLLVFVVCPDISFWYYTFVLSRKEHTEQYRSTPKKD